MSEKKVIDIANRLTGEFIINRSVSGVLDCVTEDIEWIGLEEELVRGKESLRCLLEERVFNEQEPLSFYFSGTEVKMVTSDVANVTFTASTRFGPMRHIEFKTFITLGCVKMNENWRIFQVHMLAPGYAEAKKAHIIKQEDNIIFDYTQKENTNHSEEVLTEEDGDQKQYFHELQYQEDVVTTNLICRAKVNITKKVIEKYNSFRDFGIDYKFGMSFEDTMRIIMSTPWSQEDRNALRFFLNLDRLKKLYFEGESSHSFEYERRLEDGSSKWLRVTVRIFENIGQKELIAFVSWFDITTEKLTNLVMQNIANTSYEFVSIVNKVTKNYYMLFNADDNSKTLNYYEDYDRSAKFVADSIRHLFVEEEDYNLVAYSNTVDNVVKQLEKEDSYHFYVHMYREKSEEARTYFMEYHYIDKQKTQILVTRKDVSDYIKKETLQREKLQKALFLAEKANQAKTDFLSRMSHDIRTPLNAIIGTTELAYDEIDDKDSIKEHLDIIESSSHFLLGLINDILDISKMESDKIELNEEIAYVEDFKKNVINTFLPMMEAKKIQFHFDMHCGHDCIMMDALRYQQIFFNLLSNAVKFTDEGGQISFTAEAIAGAPKGMAKVRHYISDNGCGMSDEYMEHIFEPFTRDTTAEITKTEGSGLGLAIVKNIVEAMGGTITVSSKRGEGTTFVVDLCLREALPEKEKKSDACEEYTLEGLSILLVEDNKINCMIAKRLLEKKGCRVTTAENGKIALDLFVAKAEHTFDVILMDIRMPVMNGLEASEEIRKSSKADAKCIPIIAMTADAFVEDKERTRKAQMNAHLAKPIDTELLYHTIAEFCCEQE